MTTTATPAELQAALEACYLALELWERWEADIIADEAAWFGGRDAYPTICEPHYSKLVPKLQQIRSEAKALAKAAIATDAHGGTLE